MLLVLLCAAPARAGVFTFDSSTNVYTYTGDFFNFCGFGCPENAPADPRGVDYLTATLTFAAPLSGNLIDASPVPISWTMSDFFGELSLGGPGSPNGFPGDIDDGPVPGLVLSTNASGDIIRWVLAASEGIINAEGRFEGTSAAALNPPFFCGDECGDLGITDIMVIDQLLPTEWIGIAAVPAAAPEPAAVTLLGIGVLGLARRRLQSPHRP
jgi:hypothetical protein